jgi:hypothetical protein
VLIVVTFPFHISAFMENANVSGGRLPLLAMNTLAQARTESKRLDCG